MKTLTPAQLDERAMNLGAWHQAMERLTARVQVEHHDEAEAFKGDMRRRLRLVDHDKGVKHAS